MLHIMQEDADTLSMSSCSANLNNTTIGKFMELRKFAMNYGITDVNSYSIKHEITEITKFPMNKKYCILFTQTWKNY